MKNFLQNHRRALLNLAKLVVLALLVWGMARTLGDAFAKLQENPPQVDWRMVLACAGLYLLGELPQAIFWYGVLRGAGQVTTFRQALYTFYTSQAGKYAPGKALVIVIRAAMLRGPAIEKTVVVATCFIETLTAIAVGALVAMLVLGYDRFSGGTPTEAETLLFYAAIGIFFATGIPTLPPIFKRLLRLTGVGKLNPHAADRIGQVSPRVMLGGSLLMVGGWFIQGLSLWAALRCFGQAGGPLEHLAWHTAVVSLSVGAGFILMLPAGLGGREFVHLNLLARLYPESTVVFSALLLRIVWLIAEAVISIILYLGGKWWFLPTAAHAPLPPAESNPSAPSPPSNAPRS